jgi:hypothetical protein
MERVRKTDPVLGQLRAVWAAWLGAFGEAKKTTAEAVAAAEATQSRIVELNDPSSLLGVKKTVTERILINPALRDAFLSVAGKGGKIEISALGRWIGKYAERQVDLDDGSSFTLMRAGMLDGNQQWQVLRTPAHAKPAEPAAERREPPDSDDPDDPDDPF